MEEGSRSSESRRWLTGAAVLTVVLAAMLFAEATVSSLVWAESNRSSEVGSALLDDGIARAFELKLIVGPYQVLQRR